MRTLDNILVVIMGGGEGTRLYPLTQERAKPAVPIAGKYRLIDIPISNCINSGIYRMAVLTQYSSVSLHRHISSTYIFDAFHCGYVQIWAAEQTTESHDWYQGTADAVRKQLVEIRTAGMPYVLILSGDQLYRMNYSELAKFHWDNNADVTVAVQPVSRADAPRLGILKRDEHERIQRFAEKPQEEEILQQMISRPGEEKPYFGSMGIYMFNTDVLCEVLDSCEFDDFGSHVIPYCVDEKQVFGFYFDGYWADIGTIRSFYEVNLALTDSDPPFHLIDEGWPIYTHARYLPGAEVENALLRNVLLAEGCYIKDAQITRSIVGLRSQIRKGVTMKDTVMMGADYYGFFRRWDEEDHEVQLGVGRDCYIEGAIIDKNARIGAGTTILPFPRGTEIETASFIVRDGIVIIPKKTTIPPNTRIAPNVELD